MRILYRETTRYVDKRERKTENWPVKQYIARDVESELVFRKNRVMKDAPIFPKPHHTPVQFDQHDLTVDLRSLGSTDKRGERPCRFWDYTLHRES